MSAGATGLTGFLQCLQSFAAALISPPQLGQDLVSLTMFTISSASVTTTRPL